MQSNGQGNDGFGAIGLVLVIASIGAIIGTYSGLRSQSALKSSDINNANQEATDLSINALGVFQSLMSAPNPTIYPDPYLPVKSAVLATTPSAKPNPLWGSSPNTIMVYSKSYHASPEGKDSTSYIRFNRFETNKSSRPYLITHAAVVADSKVDTALLKNATNGEAKAKVEIDPPPTPSCSMAFSGNSSVQGFQCIQSPAMMVNVIDPSTGKPVIDPATGKPKQVLKPATFMSCPGVARGWAHDTDAGQTVTAHFMGNGVVVDASVRQAPGLEGPLNFAAGTLSKSSVEVPYPGATRLLAKNVGLSSISFVARNSQWIELSVAGPDGSRKTCLAGIHVNLGPTLNTAGDSWGSDTLVQMADGSFKKISTLKYGHMLWNPKFKRPEKVLYVHETPPPTSMVEIKLGDKKIDVTSLHPFVSRRGLLLAQDLKPGDQLPSADRNWQTISALRTYKPSSDAKVYDIFLDSDQAPSDRLLNMDGLLAPSYEWQRELAELPALTLFDLQQPLDLF